MTTWDRNTISLSSKVGFVGKYYREAKAGTNLVLIDPELASVFPDTEIREPRTPPARRYG